MPQPRIKLDDLVEILEIKGYFAFEKDAKTYVNAIYNFIYSIPSQQQYHARKDDYGAYYSKYKPNKNTTYYITFDIIDGYYFVQNIITNHTPEYPIYIKE